MIGDDECWRIVGMQTWMDEALKKHDKKPTCRSGVAVEIQRIVLNKSPETLSVVMVEDKHEKKGKPG